VPESTYEWTLEVEFRHEKFFSFEAEHPLYGKISGDTMGVYAATPAGFYHFTRHFRPRAWVLEGFVLRHGGIVQGYAM